MLQWPEMLQQIPLKCFVMLLLNIFLWNALVYPILENIFYICPVSLSRYPPLNSETVWTTYVRVVGKIPDSHFNALLSSNPGDMVLILVESRGTDLSRSFPFFLNFVSQIGEQRYIEVLVMHFPNNPDIHGYVGKFPVYPFNLCLSSNLGLIF